MFDRIINSDVHVNPLVFSDVEGSAWIRPFKYAKAYAKEAEEEQYSPKEKALYKLIALWSRIPILNYFMYKYLYRVACSKFEITPEYITKNQNRLNPRNEELDSGLQSFKLDKIFIGGNFYSLEVSSNILRKGTVKFTSLPGSERPKTVLFEDVYREDITNYLALVFGQTVLEKLEELGLGTTLDQIDESPYEEPVREPPVLTGTHAAFEKALKTLFAAYVPYLDQKGIDRLKAPNKSIRALIETAFRQGSIHVHPDKQHDDGSAQKELTAAKDEALGYCNRNLEERYKTGALAILNTFITQREQQLKS